MNLKQFNAAVVVHRNKLVRVVVRKPNERGNLSILYVGEFHVRADNLIANGTKVTRRITRWFEKWLDDPSVEFEISPVDPNPEIDYGELK